MAAVLLWYILYIYMQPLKPPNVGIYALHGVRDILHPDLILCVKGLFPVQGEPSAARAPKPQPKALDHLSTKGAEAQRVQLRGLQGPHARLRHAKGMEAELAWDASDKVTHRPGSSSCANVLPLHLP